MYSLYGYSAHQNPIHQRDYYHQIQPYHYYDPNRQYLPNQARRRSSPEKVNHHPEITSKGSISGMLLPRHTFSPEIEDVYRENPLMRPKWKKKYSANLHDNQKAEQNKPTSNSQIFADPPPIPPPQALLLHHQIQTQSGSQQNHFYPGSSIDLNSSIFRQAFIDQKKMESKMSISIQQGFKTRVSNSLIKDETKPLSLISFGRINTSLKQSYLQSKQNPPQSIDTKPQLKRISKQLAACLNFKSTFGPISEIPAILNFDYKMSM